MTSAPPDFRKDWVAYWQAMEPQLQSRLRYHLRRAPDTETMQAEDYWGAIWLELCEQDGSLQACLQAIRKVAYQEWEKPARKPTSTFAGSNWAKSSSACKSTLGVPEPIAAWIECFLSLEQPIRLRTACRELGLTRQELRLRLTIVWKALHPGNPVQDLYRRLARLLARMATEGSTATLQREVKHLKYLWSILELPVELRRYGPLLRELSREPATSLAEKLSQK